MDRTDSAGIAFWVPKAIGLAFAFVLVLTTHALPLNPTPLPPAATQTVDFALEVKPLELADDPEFKQGTVEIGDFTGENVPNPKIEPRRIDAAGRKGRFIRVTVTRLAPRQNDYIFALADQMTSAAWELSRRIRNCSTGWPPSSGTVGNFQIAAPADRDPARRAVL